MMVPTDCIRINICDTTVKGGVGKKRKMIGGLFEVVPTSGGGGGSIIVVVVGGERSTFASFDASTTCDTP